MASFNVSVGAWTDSPDSDAPLYSGGSFHTTSAQGASATFQFNGTGIWLFGAKRPNYGNFTITVDGKTFAGNAQNPTAIFEQLLGGISELQMGLHTVVLTNTGSHASLDLDSLMFETQVGNPGASVTDNIVDDSNPAWKYLPSASTWAVNKLQGTIQNGIHFTQTGGAQAQLTFTGDAVALFGTVSPDHANFTVSVDGKTQSLDGGSNGIVRELHIKLLTFVQFFSNQFGPGQHTLIVTADPDEPGKQNTGRFMDVDAVTVWSANGGTPVSGSSSASPNPTSAPSSSAISVSQTTSSSQTATPGAASSNSSSATATGMAIGITIAALVGVFLVVLLIFILRRRNKLKQKKFMYVAPSPRLPIQKPDPEDGFTGYKRQTSPRRRAPREVERCLDPALSLAIMMLTAMRTPEPAPPPTPSGFPKVL
ncbi:hypothetical protein EWM64_g3544 [Hericium alpestre]|uniref:Uncharacterized protein n=1 Tax=Hericium alpestre TaxID=135208 RepID=A0A4Z0A014_9AGAM|nr:hypothetical protein EWM64_g3544 [Hericium alpestre]